VATSAESASRPRRRRGSLTFPILLVAIGAVLLLQNLGLLSWTLWRQIVPLWPLLLVFFGIELLLGGTVSWLTRLLLALTAVVAIAVGATFGFRAFAPMAPFATRTFDQPLEGATQASVRVDFGAGRLDVGKLAEPGDRLAATTFTGPSDWDTAPRLRRQGSAVDLRYQLRGEGGPWPWLGAVGQPIEMGVRLNPSLPLTLEARTGAAEASLDLSALKISRLDLEAGASQTTLRLPEAAGTTTARVRGGASRLEIEVPPGVAAQVRYEGGISAIEIDQSRFPLVSSDDGGRRRPPPPAPPTPASVAAAIVPPLPPLPPLPPADLHSGRVYRSADYDTAANKVDLTIEVGASSVTVR
jgi:LiaI-LiaF-like transmembrane region